MRSLFGYWPVTLLVLGVLLTLKDDVFALLTVTLDWLQHAEGVRLLVASNWRNYRHTLAPSQGADIVELLGVVVIGVALVLTARRSKARAARDLDGAAVIRPCATDARGGARLTRRRSVCRFQGVDD